MSTIYQDLCTGCAEVKEGGLWWLISHSCPLNQTTYRPGKFTLRHLMNAITGTNPLKSFYDLVSQDQLPHFKAIHNNPDYIDTPADKSELWGVNELKPLHPVDELCYEHARQWEIRYMKRIRIMIEKEEDLNSLY